MGTRVGMAMQGNPSLLGREGKVGRVCNWTEPDVWIPLSLTCRPRSLGRAFVLVGGFYDILLYFFLSFLSVGVFPTGTVSVTKPGVSLLCLEGRSIPAVGP